MRFPASLLSLLLLASCSREKEIQAIDFVTQHGARFLHGTLTMLDGTPKCTWTIDNGADKRTFDVPITRSDFDLLWETLTSSRDLEPYAVRGKETKLSFTDHYIVSVVRSVTEPDGVRTYMIPHTVSDASIVGWIRHLESISGEK